jgi:hypothetical protein
MKTKLLLIITFITLNLQAQTATPFVTGLLYQVGLEIKDNTLCSKELEPIIKFIQ